MGVLGYELLSDPQSFIDNLSCLGPFLVAITEELRQSRAKLEGSTPGRVLGAVHPTMEGGRGKWHERCG